VQDGDGGSDTLASIENVTGSAFNDTLIGDASANILSGGNGIDRLNGRDGDDIMRGGGGNDIYTVTDLGDVVTELSGEGNDRINVFIDYTNPDNVEFLVGKFAAVGLNLTGNENRDQITGANKINSPDTIFGLDGNDRLVGLVGNDVIDGGAGNDRIFGNSGFDVINGGAGNDVVTGQQGADTFVFGVAEGRDTVTDFDGTQDQIDLSAHSFANFAAVQAATTDIDGSAVIDLGGLNHVRLLGVLEAVLAADDFILA
jgi:serralysin